MEDCARKSNIDQYGVVDLVLGAQTEHIEEEHQSKSNDHSFRKHARDCRHVYIYSTFFSTFFSCDINKICLVYHSVEPFSISLLY